MSDTTGDIPSESIHEYCYKLGLQIRDNESTNKMEVACSDVLEEQTSEVPSRSPVYPAPEVVPKTNHDCKNCGRCFSSSRQYLKHKCSTKESPESSSKSKRRGKRRRVVRNLAAKAEKKGMEPTPQVDEDISPTIVHMKDHTYNRDDKNNESPAHEETPSNKVAKNPMAKCELCQMFPDSVVTVKDNPHGQCEKCQELATNRNKESTSDDKTETATPTDKKRKYIFKKPEEFCPHCNKGFHSEKRLAKHEKVCGKDLVCEFCGEDFNGTGQHAYSKYEEHYYTHVKEKPFHCNVCNKGFVRKPDLDKHNVIHTTEYESQTCMQCGAVFATTKLLNKHKRKHARPTWDCPKCNKQFVRKVIYEKHMLTCQVKVSCEVCGKIFTCLSKNVKYRYQEHMFIHTGEKPYKCQYCEHAFRDRSTRKKHERTHTGEKPYPCTLCDRSFSQLRILRNHVRTHTGEKPFACELCDLRFAKQCNLKYHIRVHTKEKPYTCQLCHKSFTQSGTYHKHMRRHQSRETGSNPPETKTTKTDEVQGELPSKSEAEVPIPTEPDQVPTEPEVATEQEVTIIQTENSVNEQVVQEVPIATDEITINTVSEGNADGTTLTTIDVEQISNMFAS